MKYSIVKIIKNDWPSLAAAVGIPIVWGIHVIFPLIIRKSHGLPVLFPAVVTLLLLSLLYWRISRIARLFASGNTVTGKVTGLYIVKDRGRLEFSFEHNGTAISSWIPVHQTKQVLSFTDGTPVTVAYDGEHPTRAIIMELFAK
jgi:hypothetical protein